jgi:hypothetical protein
MRLGMTDGIKLRARCRKAKRPEKPISSLCYRTATPQRIHCGEGRSAMIGALNCHEAPTKRPRPRGWGSWGERPGPVLFGEEQSHDSVFSASDNSYFGEGAAGSAALLFLTVRGRCTRGRWRVLPSRGRRVSAAVLPLRGAGLAWPRRFASGLGFSVGRDPPSFPMSLRHRTL